MESTTIFISNIRAILLATMLGVTMTALPEAVYGQKAPKTRGADKPVLEGTLSEASVMPRLWAFTYEVEPLKLRLNLINPSGKKARVGIRDSKNQLVFQDTFWKGYSRTLNLNPMPPGFYRLHIYSRRDHISRHFKIQSTLQRDVLLAEPNQDPASKLMTSIYKTGPTRFMLILANANGKRVEIVIRNEKGEVIYQGYGSGQQVAKAFDLDTLIDGKYSMDITGKDARLAQDFEVRSSDKHTLA